MTAEQIGGTNKAFPAHLTVEERLFQLLRYLGIHKAHFAARRIEDWQGLASASDQPISSLTLLCPVGLNPDTARRLASRLLVFTGDRGQGAGRVGDVVASLQGATLKTLTDYSVNNTSDFVADRTDEIGSALIEFLERMDLTEGGTPMTLPEGEGEVAGVSYRIQGTGPPLVLLPLGYTPSQWEPVLPRLRERYCTITLGGAHMGMVAFLEDMGSTALRSVVRSVIDEVALQPGESVLDVGCGSGVHGRWLAHRTTGSNPILGVDFSPYLLREAAALAKAEGLDGTIHFQEGNVEALPFPDNSFDVTMSVLVMMFVDPDRMLREMVRVTKPGGRVGVVVWARDRGDLINAPLRAELREKVEAIRRGDPEDRGCADASLYRRFFEAGLTRVKMLPQLAVFDGLSRMQGTPRGDLSPEEAKE